jgi:hypothetical protein
MKKKVLKGAGLLLLALAGLEVLYVVAGNWAIRSGFLARLLSRKPEKFQMEWASGRTTWPGIVHLEGLRLRGQSERTQSFLQADRCTARMHLFALAACRVHFYAIEADGVSLWIRRRREPGKAKPLDRFAPPIPGLAQDAPPPKRKSAPSPWTLHFGGVQARNVREIWTGPYRTSAQGRAAGESRYRLRGALEVEEASVVLESATIRVGDEAIASNLRVEAVAQVHRVVPREHQGRPFLRFLSGRIRCAGDVGGLGFLNEAFGRRAPVSFQGTGNVEADLAFRRGVMGPASSLSWRGTTLTASAAGMAASGKGEISGGTGPSGTAFSLAARWSEIAVSGDGFGPILLKGPGLTATLSGAALDLASEGEKPAVTLDLGESSIEDLSPLNALLPAKLPVAILPGSAARIQGRVELGSGGPSGRATIEGPRAGVKLGERSLRGGFFAKLALAGGDLREKSFDLSGSRAGFANAALLDSRGAPSGGPWSGEAHLEQATLHLKAPLGFQSKVRLRMTDSRPVVAALAAESKAAGWFKGVLNVKDVSGTAQVRTAGHQTSLKRVDVQGKGLQLLADLRMAQGRTDGALYAQLHHLSACVLFDGRERHWKVIGARKAYDERLSTMER